MLHFFNGTDGAFPYAGVTLDSAGNLYGTTSAGGAHGVGTVFQLIPNGDGTWTENVMHSFQKDGNDGYTPYASPIFDQSGNLYGTTFAGGVNNDGTVFELSPNGNGGWKESILHTFSGADGELPIAGLIFDVTGNLYGTTYGGGGTVFKLVPNGGGAWTESVLYTFTGRDGKQPFAGVSFDAAGNLYGTTFYGGAFGWGAIFKLAPTKDGSWRESVVWSFSQKGKDGDLVNAGLTLDAVGNLYGETNVGGKYGWGVAFRLTPANGGWEETILHAFKDHPGAEPVAGMIFDANGDLYGTTAGDGGSVLGSVFEISP